MKRVSVIICCYNGEHFLNRCFSCLLNQTYKDIEAIFIDDGSADRSYKEALSYQPAFSAQGMELKCYTQENKGAGGAAALGLLHATGKYICCYDVDDILYPESIEMQAQFLETHPSYAIVRTNGYKTRQVSDKQVSKTLFVTDPEEKQDTDIFEDILLCKTNNWAGSYMVRSDKLWQVYPGRHIIESRFGQNLPILLAVAYRNKSGFIDIPLMEYVYNSESFTRKANDLSFHVKNFQGYKDLRLAVLRQLKVRDEAVFKALDICYAKIFMDLAINYHNKSLYLDYYRQLRRIAVPDDIYKYHYHLFKKNPVLSLFYRGKLFIKKRFK